MLALSTGVLHPTEEGTPQGGVISPVLMNLTLNGLERGLQEYLQTLPRTRRKAAKVHLVRFADDFIATGSSPELLEHTIKPLIETFLGQRGLILSPEKTCITQINDGFDFLGHRLRKYKRGSRYHLLSTPSPKRTSKHSCTKSERLSRSRQRRRPITRSSTSIQSFGGGRTTIGTAPARPPLQKSIVQSTKPCGSGQHGATPTKAHAGSNTNTSAPSAGETGTFSGKSPDQSRKCRRSGSTMPPGQRFGGTAKSGGQPTRMTRLGTLLRGTPGREDGRGSEGTAKAAHFVESARWALPGLQPKDHRANRVAQPPHRLALAWRQRPSGEPRVTASQLSSAGP